MYGRTRVISIALICAVLIASIVFVAPMVFAADSMEQGTTSSVTVSTIVDITLSKVPIAWGTLSPSTENNLALADQENPATLKVESDTNVKVDIYIKGTDWSDGAGHTLSVSYCHYDNDNMAGGAGWATLLTSYATGPNQGYWENVMPGTFENSYWFINIPTGQWTATYTNNIYFKAVKDNTQP